MGAPWIRGTMKIQIRVLGWVLILRHFAYGWLSILGTRPITIVCTVGNHVIESRKTYAETGVYLQNNVIYNLYVVYQGISIKYLPT